MVIERDQRMYEPNGSDPLATGPLSAALGSAHSERPSRVITTKPQLPISDQELRARIQWGHQLSSHFELLYDRISFSEKRAFNLLESLEIAYSLIFHFTHESFPDRLQVYAIDQRQPALLGRTVRPHFNLEERAIYLVESSSQNVQAELVELLTHGMRIARYSRHYGRTPGWALLEDGFAIFLSERLSTQPEVFPFYGAEADVIASHLYRSNKETLVSIWNMAHHSNAHHIILAGAFILYLGDTFSDDRVSTFSKSDYAITNDTFRTFFGGTLGDLEAAWQQHLPLSLLSLTEEEQDVMVQHWDRAIDCRRHY